MALVKAKVGSQRSGSCRKDRAMMGTRTRNSQMEGTVIARINPAVSAIAGNSRQVVSPTVGSFKEFKGPKGPMGWDSFAWKIPRRARGRLLGRGDGHLRIRNRRLVLLQGNLTQKETHPPLEDPTIEAYA